MKVKNFATQKVATVGREESLLQAARIMREFHVGCLVVVENVESAVQPIGILTDRDLVIEAMAQNLPPDSTSVDAVMSEDLVTCLETDDVDHAVELMKRNGIRRLPVVDEEFALKGILCFDDVIEKDQKDFRSLGDVPKTQRNWEREVRG